MYHYPWGAAGLRIPGRELSRLLDHLARQGPTLRVAHDHVASRGSPTDVEPQVPLVGDTEGQIVVVCVTAADEDLEAVHDDGAIRPTLAAHGH